MEVTDHCCVYLFHPRLHGRLLPQERQRGRVVTEEDHLLAGLEIRERLADALQMIAPQFGPLAALLHQRFGFEHGESQERRGNSHQDVLSQPNLPEWRYSQL